MSEPGADPARAASALVAVLEATWSAIAANHPELPTPVLVVAAGSGRRPYELKWGHFAASRWNVAGDSRPEVLIGGEGLRRPPIQVFGTLLHEAAHGIANAREARDTSRQGRYHNSVFRRLAIEVGLEVARDGSRGWSGTEVPTATAARYRPVLADLSGALVLWRRAEHGTSGRAPTRNPTVCRCECGRRIRVSERTLAQGPIVCGRCQSEFRSEDLTRTRQPGTRPNSFNSAVTRWTPRPQDRAVC